MNVLTPAGLPTHGRAPGPRHTHCAHPSPELAGPRGHLTSRPTQLPFLETWPWRCLWGWSELGRGRRSGAGKDDRDGGTQKTKGGTQKTKGEPQREWTQGTSDHTGQSRPGCCPGSGLRDGEMYGCFLHLEPRSQCIRLQLPLPALGSPGGSLLLTTTGWP